MIASSDLNKDIFSDPKLRKMFIFAMIPVLAMFLYFMRAAETADAEAAAHDAKLARLKMEGLYGSPSTPVATSTPEAPPDPRETLSQLYAAARDSYERKSYDAARDRGKAALELAVELKEEETRLDCLQLLADVAVARGRPDAALEYYRQMSPARYQVVFAREVENFEKAVNARSKAEMSKYGRMVSQMTELGQPNDPALVKRALAAAQKGNMPEYVSKLKGIKS